MQPYFFMSAGAMDENAWTLDSGEQQVISGAAGRGLRKLGR